jgi:glycine betaine/proline transport system substrate-binding protein
MFSKQKIDGQTSKCKSLFRGLIFSVLSFTTLAFSVNTHAACGTVSVGEMNWASGQIVAKISSFILREGYGCKIKTIPTSTVPGITSLVNKGEPNFIPEAWENSVKAILKKGESKGNVKRVGEMFPDAGEKWYIPAYTAKKHNINSIQDVLANPEVFADPESPGKGRFHNCPAGWACGIINTNLFNAYGMGKKFNLFDTGSGEGLKLSIAKAFKRNEAWLGYYWAPTAVLGKYDLKALTLNPYDKVGHDCNQDPECDAPHAGQYPPATVVKLVTTELANRDAEVTDFLEKYSIPSKALLDVLAWKEDQQADANQAAGYFIVKYEKIWHSWLPQNVLEKIEAAL